MALVLDTNMSSRLAFHRIRVRTGRYLHQQIPSRFAPMTQEDTDDFVEAAFMLCRKAQLVSEDELRYVCVLMTLFGHRFYADPRYDEISRILLDPSQQARQRQTQPLVEKMVLRNWGGEQDRKTGLARLHHRLSVIGTRGDAYDDADLIPPGGLRPSGQIEKHFAGNARTIAARLRLEDDTAVRICFWTAWILGVDFDRNPQFRWLVRSVESMGEIPMRRQRRLISWLSWLTRDEKPETMPIDKDIVT